MHLIDKRNQCAIVGEQVAGVVMLAEERPGCTVGEVAEI